ncbi:hypothetical protein BDZ97DRAFT_484087 [Flammula alnicola]|nr:hypothetical protein BDZ97DRAFT_484087 [Flammula alnicola]
MMLENERKIQWYKKLLRSVRAAIRIRRRILSAVYRTPPEVWGQIFVFCLATNEEYLEPGQDTAPLLLCRICHMWRNAAIHTPALWNSLVISLRGQATSKAFVQTWIGRSGALPLSFHILWGPTQSLQFHDRIFDYLLTLAHRWRSVRLSVVKGLVWQAHGFPTRAHKLLSYPMPILDTLELEPYTSLGVAGLQRNAPRLRELRLNNGSINPMHLMTSSPWTHLASFRSPYPLDTSHVLRIFKACPNLVECDFKVVSCPAVEGPRTMLRVHSLKKLTIDDTSAKVVDSLFRFVELPSLEELNVSAESWSFESRIPWTATELLLLLHRSAEVKDFMLRRLRIEGLNVDEANVKSLVFGIPTLVAFDIRNREMELSGRSWVELLRHNGKGT